MCMSRGKRDPLNGVTDKSENLIDIKSLPSTTKKKSDTNGGLNRGRWVEAYGR